MKLRATACAIAGIAAAAAGPAQGAALCGSGEGLEAADGRLLNHFPYAASSAGQLVRPPRALGGQCAAIHSDMRADLVALLARARSDPAVGSALVAVSCFRSRAHQHRLFCRQGRSTVPEVQAYQVAPPGFSEHSTGLAIDFGDRRGRCKLTACFAATAVGGWLAKNARDFGFEMSFPDGNGQGVAFEPWHWRWVGRSADERSRRARTIFAAARQQFPAGDQPPFAGALALQLAAATQAVAIATVPAPPGGTQDQSEQAAASGVAAASGSHQRN